MNHQVTYLHCGEHLKGTLKSEMDEVVHIVELIEWEREFKVGKSGSTLLRQTAYNKRFEAEFKKLGWETKSMLSQRPRLIGIFGKTWCLWRSNLETAQPFIEIFINFSMVSRMDFFH